MYRSLEDAKADADRTDKTDESKQNEGLRGLRQRQRESFLGFKDG